MKLFEKCLLLTKFIHSIDKHKIKWTLKMYYATKHR